MCMCSGQTENNESNLDAPSLLQTRVNFFRRAQRTETRTGRSASGKRRFRCCALVCVKTPHPYSPTLEGKILVSFAANLTKSNQTQLHLKERMVGSLNTQNKLPSCRVSISQSGLTTAFERAIWWTIFCCQNLTLQFETPTVFHMTDMCSFDQVDHKHPVNGLSWHRPSLRHKINTRTAPLGRGTISGYFHLNQQYQQQRWAVELRRGIKRLVRIRGVKTTKQPPTV